MFGVNLVSGVAPNRIFGDFRAAGGNARVATKNLGGSGASVAGFNLSRQNILKLLWWFELELTDRSISTRTEADYHQVHRFFGKVRQQLQKEGKVKRGRGG